MVKPDNCQFVWPILDAANGFGNVLMTSHANFLAKARAVQLVYLNMSGTLSILRRLPNAVGEQESAATSPCTYW